jgi:hypothetical protein
MVEQNHILVKHVFKQQAESEEDTIDFLTELDCRRSTNRQGNCGCSTEIVILVDPSQFCGRVKELAKFLETIQSNVPSDKHLFPTGDSDQAKYAVCP